MSANETLGYELFVSDPIGLNVDGPLPREVAERLFVSFHTVSSYLRPVFSKLGITSRVELARLARDYEIA